MTDSLAANLLRDPSQKISRCARVYRAAVPVARICWALTHLLKAALLTIFASMGAAKNLLLLCLGLRLLLRDYFLNYFLSHGGFFLCLGLSSLGEIYFPECDNIVGQVTGIVNNCRHLARRNFPARCGTIERLIRFFPTSLP